MNVDEIWMNILSRDERAVLAAWHDLSTEERAAVLDHLQRMATEPDWTEPQRISARAALDILSASGENA